MATRKHYHGGRGGGREPIAFGRPTIGPRVYLVKGPSGWSETYDRKLADEALAKFLHPLEPRQVIQNFWTKVHIDSCEETWDGCIEHLASVTGTDKRAIPEIVVVAFWAQALLFDEQEGTN